MEDVQCARVQAWRQDLATPVPADPAIIVREIVPLAYDEARDMAGAIRYQISAQTLQILDGSSS